MKRFTHILILFALTIVSGSLYAQFDTEVPIDSLENKILYNKQRTYGIIAHSLGFGINFRTGTRMSIFKTRMLEFEFVTMKAYKQVKLINPYVVNSKRFVLGKMNDAFFVRINVIWKKLLNRKPYWGGIEVRWLYGGGFSLGIAKPYYLYVYKDVDGTGENYVVVPEQYDPKMHSTTYIHGRAPFSNGLDELTVHPGLNLKTGLNFEFGTRNTKIKSLELGAAIDILPTGLTIMASSENQIFFPTAYLILSFGQRYNKY